MEQFRVYVTRAIHKIQILRLFTNFLHSEKSTLFFKFICQCLLKWKIIREIVEVHIMNFKTRLLRFFWTRVVGFTKKKSFQTWLFDHLNQIIVLNTCINYLYLNSKQGYFYKEIQKVLLLRNALFKLILNSNFQLKKEEFWNSAIDKNILQLLLFFLQFKCK